VRGGNRRSTGHLDQSQLGSHLPATVAEKKHDRSARKMTINKIKTSEMCKQSFSNIRLTTSGGTIFLYHVNQPSRRFHGLLDISVDDNEPSIAWLVASKNGLWIVLGKGKNLLNLD
jgi:hypothetical protein